MSRRHPIRHLLVLLGLLPCCWATARLSGGSNSRSIDELFRCFSLGSPLADGILTSDRTVTASRGAADSASLQSGSLDDSPLRQQCLDELQRHRAYPFDFDLTSLGGQRLRLSQFAGRVLIVDIWATWCPPCRREIPHFVQLHQRYGDSGLSLVGINYERAGTEGQARQVIEAFRQRQPIPYPLALGTPSLRDQIPGFRGFPTTLMIDRTGRVRATLVGAQSLEYLETMARLLLDEPHDQSLVSTAAQPPQPPAPPRVQLNPFAAGPASP